MDNINKHYGVFSGNMWGQTWGNLFDILKPYPYASALNVTQALRDQVTVCIFCNKYDNKAPTASHTLYCKRL